VKRLIFLDIDGVMNCGDGLDDDKQVLLGHIIDRTGAELIISSSWRHWDFKDTIAHFKKEGFWFCDKIAAQTKRGYKIQDSTVSEEIIEWHSVPRGFEIRMFLKEMKEKCRYIILDDDSDMLYEQRDNFIHCDWQIGLTKEDAELAIAKLSS
jgi:hypothetical protein